MHPRNPYQLPVDFDDLANAYPPLRDHLVSGNSNTASRVINFQDDVFLRRLTEAILHRDFGLHIDLPKDRLCPPVPNRMNYVLWIQDIINAYSTLLHTHPESVKGIDIGTGASAIYPLLTCKLQPTWEVVATEIDEYSFAYAEKNILMNQLQDRIKLYRAATNKSILFPLENTTNQSGGYDFTMCNPPFYNSIEEVFNSSESKRLPPNAVCTGSEVEMIFSPGGEAEFVGQMVRESVKFQMGCRWYTSMLGKMSSISKVIDMLQSYSITNYAITEFVQGQTRRWAIAWSFGDMHLPDSIARISNPNHPLRNVMPLHNTVSIPFPNISGRIAEDRIQDALLCFLQSKEGISIYEVSAHEPKSRLQPILVGATRNSWSRSARRKGYSKPQVNILDTVHDFRLSPFSQSSLQLVCCLRWVSPENGNSNEYVLEFQWIYGKDRTLFDTFSSHVGSKLNVVFQTDMI